jgi:hypothetical protein
MLIGARWIGLITEAEEFDANDICVWRHSGAWRTRDVDEAARIWRATAATTPVQIFITPMGRECGRGIELAVALVQRGVRVNYGPVSAQKDDLNWVDGGALEDLPRPNREALGRPVLVRAVNPLPATGRTKLEPPAAVGQGRRDAAKDGIDQLLDRQA